MASVLTSRPARVRRPSKLRQSQPKSPKLGATPSARTINPAVPRALDRICSRAIAQNPRDRYRSARSLADDLDRWLLQHRGGKVRLSFTFTAVLLGLALALLLTVGIRGAFLPWGQASRADANQVPNSLAAPAASGAWPPPIASGASPSSTASGGSSAIEAAEKPANLLANPPAVELVGNSKKGIYHRSNCFYVQSISEANHVSLRDANEAATQGMKPCAHCNPPVGSSSGTKGLR